MLEALWSCDAPQSVREVMTRLHRSPQLAYTTVLTVLRRLYDKGMLGRVKHGKAFLYEPRVSREQWMGRRAAQELLGRDGAPSRGVLLAFLDSAERSDPELLDRLSALIDGRRHRDDVGGNDSS